jgi:hypothetical protein
MLTAKEFRRARGELWGDSFNSTFGKRASKIYREHYKKHPPQRFSKSKRNLRDPVNVYPCGILEEAYRQLMAECVPLLKSESNSWTALIISEHGRWKELERRWVEAWQSQATPSKIDTANVCGKLNCDEVS